MMPAASNKIETKPSAEALDPTKQFLSLLDKKVRNIEKRKSKLDAVRAKQDAGEILEREQKEAITHYEEVIANLEFARELQKNFNQVAADIEKQQKKQAKREKMEKATCEVKRIMEVLQVQTTLDSMGGDAVRQHFKTGKFGAVVLTEDNLTALDDLYQLICPTREGEENFGNKLNVASEHVISLLEFRDRAVAGSTYKELMELIDLINGCGYFERAREAEETSAEPTAAEEVAEQKVEEETPTPVVQAPAETFPEVAESDLQNNATVQQSASDLEEPNLSHQQVLPTVVQQSEVAHTSYYNQPTTTTPTPTAFQPSQTQPPPQNASAKTRPLPEIISSVRGTFSFLQDSEIELDSPHMDPAVVAAQPMMRPSSASSQLPVGFPAPPVVDQSLDTEAQDPLSLSQQSLTQSNLDYSGASQSFAQAGLSHSQNMPSAPGADNLFQSGVEETTKPTVPQQQQPQHSAPHVMLGQGRSAGEPANPPFDLPPSIPMPPTQAQQDAAQLAGEKKFTLNASATEFQSRTMYPSMPPSMQNMASQPPPSQTQAPPPSQAPHQPTTQPDTRTHPPSAGNPDFPPAQNFAQAAGDFSQVAGNFQSGNFQRGGRGGNTGTSGYRGGQRGGRGGTTAGNMQNGFNPRPQNGTSRPGTRGGTPFQGYPPRTDYRPDGYQGYNANGFGNPAAFQKRGGAGGPGGPSFPRGGAGGNRGATGMRPGGPPRTAPPRGAGVVRGGMTNRPTNQ
ncbi:caprin-1-like [Littorina saxatilis]|uniref:Caprin-1 dimerization domain-containing protein n=1 Tax=Littorina saxatilis TaxID=31220 RepID=A0AAN9G829_9CAEN